MRVGTAIGICLAGILAIGLISESKGVPNDPAIAQTYYCEGVNLGDWPDYKGTYKNHC